MESPELTNLIPHPMPKLLSLVVPVFNEEEVLPLLLARLSKLAQKLPCESEWIFIDDGSKDSSARLLEKHSLKEPRIKLIEFSRNFGHQIALTAGIDMAVGDAVVLMDSDLQDPPELIREMLVQFTKGYDVVYAQRANRQHDTLFKRMSAAGFYWIMRRFVHRDLPSNVGDFRLMSRDVVEVIRGFREGHRFLRGLTTWLGFRQTAVTFERPARAAGESKFPLSKMTKFAWDSIVSFSSLPIRVSLISGAILFLLGTVFGAIGIYRKLVYGDTVPGWTSIVTLQTLIGGTNLFCLGMIGSYVGRIYEESKSRPLYVVRRTVNIQWSREPNRTSFPKRAKTAAVASARGTNKRKAA